MKNEKQLSEEKSKKEIYMYIHIVLSRDRFENKLLWLGNYENTVNNI